jgi:hypothetical protein
MPHATRTCQKSILIYISDEGICQYIFEINYQIKESK